MLITIRMGAIHAAIDFAEERAQRIERLDQPRVRFGLVPPGSRVRDLIAWTDEYGPVGVAVVEGKGRVVSVTVGLTVQEPDAVPPGVDGERASRELEEGLARIAEGGDHTAEDQAAVVPRLLMRAAIRLLDPDPARRERTVRALSVQHEDATMAPPDAR